MVTLHFYLLSHTIRLIISSPLALLQPQLSASLRACFHSWSQVALAIQTTTAFSLSLSNSVAIKPSGLPLKVSALVMDDTFMTRRKMHFTVLVVTQ